MSIRSICFSVSFNSCVFCFVVVIVLVLMTCLMVAMRCWNPQQLVCCSFSPSLDLQSFFYVVGCSRVGCVNIIVLSSSWINIFNTILCHSLSLIQLLWSLFCLIPVLQVQTFLVSVFMKRLFPALHFRSIYVFIHKMCFL